MTSDLFLLCVRGRCGIPRALRHIILRKSLGREVRPRYRRKAKVAA